MNRVFPPLCRALQMVLPVSCLLLLLTGCYTSKAFNIVTRPAGAAIKVDGVERGPSPLEEKLTFASAGEIHSVVATLPGYKEKSVQLTRDSAEMVLIDLKTRPLRISVEPLPATISIDGRPVKPIPLKAWQQDMDFEIDAAGKWSSHTVTVERLGFQKMQKTITGSDKDMDLEFELAPMLKSITITTNPPGASLYLEGEKIGISPLTQDNLAFSIPDPAVNEWGAYKLEIRKPGFTTVEAKISWDDGQTDYAYELKPISSTVNFITNPAGATVTIEGKELPRDANGVSSIELRFDPLPDGSKRTYKASVSKKAANAEWEPAEVTVSFDKAEYNVTLREIKTVGVDLLTAQPQRPVDSWQMMPKVIKTVARKDVTEVGDTQPQKLTDLPKGTMIDSLAVSSANELVFTVVEQGAGQELHSWLKLMSAAGTPGIKDMTNGKSLDLHPSFTANGKEIVFSSNRGGKHHSIWSLATSGQGGLVQYTSDQTNDLWPSIDPTGKLYYQSLVDNQSVPRVFQVEPGKFGRVDIIPQQGGSEPRVSPAETKTVLACSLNDKTGKRDIVMYKIGDKIVPENLTNTPDADEYGMAWSPDGRRIAFVSDRGVDEDKKNNYDIWIIDLKTPERPIQITTNGSMDDYPAWSPNGDAIYFRSNRGGEWQIWKIAVPAAAQ